MFVAISYRQWVALIVLLMPISAGCTAFRSVPARRYPSAVFHGPRSAQEPINFIHLRQDPPPVYMLGARDVLGIYIEGVLGQEELAPPVHFPEKGDLPPAVGYPIPIRDDGTLSLPLVPPLQVAGLSLAQAERLIRNAYTVDQKILQPGRDRIIVTLMRPRTYQVLVVREDSTTPTFRRGTGEGELVLGSGKRGATYTVELPAYENDVLHALSESGGLPGLDAKNEVTILRGGFDGAEGPTAYLTSLLEEADAPPFAPELLDLGPGPDMQQSPSNSNVLKIPLRIAPGEPAPELTQDDIILNTGDILFIESREAEVFYTGGLIRGGQFPIPRDYDLDVLGAIAMAGGSIASAAGSTGTRGAFGSSSGVGAIFPPTRVIVVRTVNGKQTSIRVNLKRALVDPQERILIEPNDFILLEYTPFELVMNLILSQVQFNYFINSFGR